MSFLSSIWNGLKDGLEAILRLYETPLEALFGQYAWALSIVLLTVTVRIFMIPLMVRQTRSMRAMQQLQPELKRIREKYKVDRSMIKTDPERYKKLKEKEREAQMALYQEHQVNPVGGCLPLLLQMPIFFALFQVLTEEARLPEFANAPFIGTSLDQSGATGAGLAAVLLVLLQVGTTFYSQKQMQARTQQASAEQAQAQKMMLYIMPVFLGYLSWTFPIGVVLYWVTTNVWTIGQQFFIFKQVEAEEAKKAEERAQARKAKRTGGSSTRAVEASDDASVPTDATPDDPAPPAARKRTPRPRPDATGGSTGSTGSGNRKRSGGSKPAPGRPTKRSG